MSLSILLMVAQAIRSPAGAERDQMLKDHEVLMVCCPIHQLQAGRVFSVLQGQQHARLCPCDQVSVHGDHNLQVGEQIGRLEYPAEAQNHLGTEVTAWPRMLDSRRGMPTNGKVCAQHQQQTNRSVFRHCWRLMQPRNINPSISSVSDAFQAAGVSFLQSKKRGVSQFQKGVEARVSTGFAVLGSKERRLAATLPVGAGCVVPPSMCPSGRHRRRMKQRG